MENFENTIIINTQEALIKNKQLLEYIKFELDKSNITSNDLKNIKKIVLDSENIIGEFNKVYLEEIALFPNLETISLKNLGFAPKEMSLLKNLKSIDFTRCEISDISKLKNLTNLSLNDTELDDVNKIAELKDLEQLEIINIKVDNFEFLKELKNLKVLKLKNIPEFSLSKINFTMPIEELSVTGIDEIDLDIISKYKNLKILSVDEKDALKNEKQLRDLQNNNIKILLNDIFEF